MFDGYILLICMFELQVKRKSSHSSSKVFQKVKLWKPVEAPGNLLGSDGIATVLYLGSKKIARSKFGLQGHK